MEEAKPAPSNPLQIPNPPTPTPQTQNLQTSQAPPPPAASRPPLHSKKRKADNVDNQNANYFKLRLLVKDLRPHFIEVLRTPDFRNCKAAHEIRKKLKRVMDVCKQITKETASAEMSKKPSEGQPLSNENKDADRPPEEKQAKRHQPDQVPDRSQDVASSAVSSETSGDEQIPGSYVIGGSNFGWNFIMYPSGKAVYYGVTKESRRVLK